MFKKTNTVNTIALISICISFWNALYIDGEKKLGRKFMFQRKKKSGIVFFLFLATGGKGGVIKLRVPIYMRYNPCGALLTIT